MSNRSVKTAGATGLIRANQTAAQREPEIGIAGRPQSQVEEQMDNLSRSINNLMEVQERLINRLGPVSEPEEANTDAEGKSPQPPLVPLADWLRDKIAQIDSLAARTEYAINRCHL